MSPSSFRSYRSAVITNAGVGLGRDIALGLAAKGYIVFGTATSAAEVQVLRLASGGRVSLTVCDMTKTEGLTAWAGGVSDALDEAGLDVLISNAGNPTPGPIEIFPRDDIRREFEMNVFGALSVINAFLPALRKAHGRIVQISTWTASVPLPFSGPLEASMAAMEVFSAVYRAELKPFGIDVVVAPAGNISDDNSAGTAAALGRVTATMTKEQRKLYGKTFGRFANGVKGLHENGIESAVAAACLIEIAERRPAPIRAAIGLDAEEMLRAVREKSDLELDALRLNLVGLA
ncbi:oxidoreductase [Ensifer sp. NM-2]|uniref:SDR family NAD(P)-dependent oxidoreductase n=1 Tax=Ensifer sp. NM-2 TaxID=2109730 RepID=UPI000D125E10|nr:SDR family NAD(P)-dependent oxidoreductase [Ensifer sp. NM-2]PSS60562.1 oxidoreductase [Ensifer sp. NM-2]